MRERELKIPRPRDEIVEREDEHNQRSRWNIPLIPVGVEPQDEPNDHVQVRKKDEIQFWILDTTSKDLIVYLGFRSGRYNIDRALS